MAVYRLNFSHLEHNKKVELNAVIKDDTPVKSKKAALLTSIQDQIRFLYDNPKVTVNIEKLNNDYDYAFFSVEVNDTIIAAGYAELMK